MHSSTGTYDPALDETRDDFLGWGSKELIDLRPLVTFKDLTDALDKTAFRWHDRVKALVETTDISLIDPHTIKICSHFRNDADFDEFNRLCTLHTDMPHGWHHYKLGLFWGEK